jgi:hypothetical protein
VKAPEIASRLSLAEYRVSPKIKIPLEEEECRWLYDWALITRWQGRPIAEVLIHIPNGSFRGYDREGAAITAGKLKAQGMQPGVYDYLVPVPVVSRGTWVPGLWLEMKRVRGGRSSRQQTSFRDRMLRLGWRCEVARGWVAATPIIENHLQGAGR